MFVPVLRNRSIEVLDTQKASIYDSSTHHVFAVCRNGFTAREEVKFRSMLSRSRFQLERIGSRAFRESSEAEANPGYEATEDGRDNPVGSRIASARLPDGFEKKDAHHDTWREYIKTAPSER